MATDRRVKYTKMVLRASLIELLAEKPISRLTIKELCQRADINRATFYSHYSDQFDLLRQIEAAFIADINSYLDHFVVEAGETNMVEILAKIFEYIDQNSSLCQVLLGNNSDLDFQTDIMNIVSERVLFEWQKTIKVDEAAADYLYTYVATGSIGIIRKWLQSGRPSPPKDMAEFVIRLVYKGIGEYIA